MRNRMGKACAGMCVLIAALLLSGCAPKQKGFAADGRPEFSNPDFTYVPPPLILAEFSGEPKYSVENNGRTASIDVAHTAQGYVMVNLVADVRARVRVSVGTQGGSDYQQALYDLNNQGMMESIPLNFGSNHYTIVIFFKSI